MELSVGYWTWIRSSSDHMIILVVRPGSWKELDSWGVSVVDSFEFGSIYFLYLANTQPHFHSSQRPLAFLHFFYNLNEYFTKTYNEV